MGEKRQDVSVDPISPSEDETKIEPAGVEVDPTAVVDGEDESKSDKNPNKKPHGQKPPKQPAPTKKPEHSKPTHAPKPTPTKKVISFI